jgi:hypothetical protein
MPTSLTLFMSYIFEIDWKPPCGCIPSLISFPTLNSQKTSTPEKSRTGTHHILSK